MHQKNLIVNFNLEIICQIFPGVGMTWLEKLVLGSYPNKNQIQHCQLH